MPKKKKNPKMYFDMDVQDAIIRYKQVIMMLNEIKYIQKKYIMHLINFVKI